MKRAEEYNGEIDWSHFEGLPIDPKPPNVGLGTVDAKFGKTYPILEEKL